MSAPSRQARKSGRLRTTIVSIARSRVREHLDAVERRRLAGAADRALN